jgi:hypothetical protein
MRARMKEGEDRHALAEFEKEEAGRGLGLTRRECLIAKGALHHWSIHAGHEKHCRVLVGEDWAWKVSLQQAATSLRKALRNSSAAL